jgi:hypothetical protein
MLLHEFHDAASWMMVAPIPRLHGNRGDLLEVRIKVEHPRSAARGKGFAKMTGLFASPLHRFVRPVVVIRQDLSDFLQRDHRMQLH